MVSLRQHTIWMLFLLIRVAHGDSWNFSKAEQDGFAFSASVLHLPLTHVQRILTTEVDSGFADDELTWQASVQHAWKQIVLAANDHHDQDLPRPTLRRPGGGHRKLDSATQLLETPLLVCDVSYGESGETCLKSIRTTFATTATLGLYNKDDMTCVIAVTAEVPTIVPSHFRIVPLTPELKMAPGLAELIALRGDEMGRIEAVPCPSAPHDAADATEIAQYLLQDNLQHRRRLFYESPRSKNAQVHWGRLLEEVGNDNNDDGNEDGQQQIECRSWILSLEMESSPDMILWNIVNPLPSYPCLQTLVVDLALLPEICAIGVTPKLESYNHVASRIVQSGNKWDQPLHDVGLNGTGIVVALSDTGLDVNSCYFRDEKEDVAFSPTGSKVNFKHRKVIQYCNWRDDKDGVAGHGTHVAGSIAGYAPSMASEGAGMAPGAKLAFFDLGLGASMATPSMSMLLGTAYLNAGAKIHSMSWGIPNKLSYSSTDHAVDTFISNNPDFLVIVAAGNYGAGNKASSVASPSLLKNGISVGASTSAPPHIHNYQEPGIEFLAYFSSRGPTLDGRRKPELVAPGQYIRSARAEPDKIGVCDNTNDSGMLFRAGTSMATPFVAGSAAIVRQYFEEGWYVNGRKDPTRGFSPRASLVKAVLINGAVDLSGIDQNSEGSTPSPVAPYDNNQGFGIVNLLASLPIKGKNDLRGQFINGRRIYTGQKHSFKVTIDNSQGPSCSNLPLSATLVWTDPPVGSFCSGSCILNDLDLSIAEVETGKLFFPNGLQGRDSINNVERVRILNPTSGKSYWVRVQGTQLIEGQDYSLVLSGCFEAVATSNPTRSPTFAPTEAPVTSLPTKRPPTNIPTRMPLPSEGTQGFPNEPCRDFVSTIAALDGNNPETCSWLLNKIQSNNNHNYSIFCQFWDVIQFCPQTCAACDVFEREFENTVGNARSLEGTVRYEGNSFEVQAKKELVIQGLDLHLSGRGVTYNIQVYTRGTGEQEEWILMCQSQVQGRGRYFLTRIPGRDCNSVRLKPQNRQVFYVTLSGAQDLIMTRGGSFSNEDLLIFSGSAVAHFDGAKFGGYGFDGIFRYRRRRSSFLECQENSENVVDMKGLIGLRTCGWLRENLVRFGYVCRMSGPAEHCPVTCNTCEV